MIDSKIFIKMVLKSKIKTSLNLGHLLKPLMKNGCFCIKIVQKRVFLIGV